MTGWIPYSERTRWQKTLTEHFNEQAGVYRSSNMDIPAQVITPALEVQMFGKLIPRVKQLIGSCVGAGAANAYVQAMVGDCYFRGSLETVKMIFPWATWGVGREYAGLHSRGDGSFGAAQAKACDPANFGYLPFDDPRLPQATINGNWIQWTETIEREWSYPPQFPIARATLEADSKKYGIHTITQIKKVDDVQQLIAQGYGVTMASMFGTRGARVQGDVSIAEWDAQWPHQMSLCAAWEHPQHGWIYLVQNQWGPSESIHPPCPTASKFGLSGCFWIKRATLQKIIEGRDGEVFGHSATGDFAPRQLDWNAIDWSFYD